MGLIESVPGHCILYYYSQTKLSACKRRKKFPIKTQFPSNYQHLYAFFNGANSHQKSLKKGELFPFSTLPVFGRWRTNMKMGLDVTSLETRFCYHAVQPFLTESPLDEHFFLKSSFKTEEVQILENSHFYRNYLIKIEWPFLSL